MILRIMMYIFLLAVVYGQNFETGDNSTVKGCDTHCSIDDPNGLACFNKTLYFFEKILLSQMRHYIAVQVNIDQWHRRQSKTYVSNFTALNETAVLSMQKYVTDDELVSNDTVAAVVSTLIDRIANNYDKQISWVPHYSCPLPCEHKYTVWRNLFIISSILNVCLIAVVVPFARRMAKNDANEALMS